MSGLHGGQTNVGFGQISHPRSLCPTYHRTFQREKLWVQARPKMEKCAVRGFTLEVRGSTQLSYEVMSQNVVDEITDPLDEDRPQNGCRKPLLLHARSRHLTPQSGMSGVVFDKRVVDPQTFQFSPYRYTEV